VQECGLYVHLLEIPVEGGHKVKDSVEWFKPCCRSSGFVVIYPILLSIPLGNIAYLVTDDLARVVSLLLAYKFALERAFAMGYGGSGNECEDLQVLEAPEFFFSTSNPELTLRGSYCLGPGQIVTGVTQGD
jgi:hypothetical protein